MAQEIIEKYIRLVTPISVFLKEKIDKYRELFGQLNLKSASFSEQELNDLKNNSESDDPSERETAASNEFLTEEKLLELIKDNASNVRKAVLENPSCPVEALKQLVEAYEAFDFSKPGSWRAIEITKEEFDLSLQHPNMSVSLLLDLYLKQKINSERLLSFAHKLSKHDCSSVFNTAKVKLPHSIKSGIVRNIRTSIGDLVNPEDVILEIDDEDGNTQQISASVLGKIVGLCAKSGDRISSGDVIVKIIIPKKTW